jgi:outer membrane protein OmpA-like peptidoglycan-associated protein
MWTNDDGLRHCHHAALLGILTHMRRTCILLTGLLCAAAPAQAQVTVDLHALDALPGGKPATESSPQHQPPPKRASKRPTVARQPKPSPAQATAAAHAPQSATSSATTAATPAAAPPATTVPNTAAPTPAPPAATLPTAPPATVALAPIVPPPEPAQAAPAPAPPISDSATSAATATGHGLRVTFGTDEADLSPASASAIHDFVQSAPSGDSASYNVVAYAAGTPEDPSTARRLSLSRALAVRSALMADGISSTHIYVRALGATAGDATPDRVDVAVLGGNTTPASATIQAPATTPTQTPANTKSQQQ